MADARAALAERIFDACKDKGTRVTSDLISFVLSLLRLNPAHRNNHADDKDEDEDEDEDEESWGKVVEVATDLLQDDSRPRLATLKSQLFFAKHYEESDETISRHRLSLRRKTGPLVRAICETEHVADERDTKKLYQRILVVITLLSGLGSPTIQAVLREASVALQSVFPPSELQHYVGLTRKQKEEQLMEMMCVVSGIRIFNRDCQRGGAGIDDLPSILENAARRTHESIVDLLARLMAKVYKFTALVEKMLSSKFAKSDPRDSDGGETNEETGWPVEMLTACRQQEIYIRKLLGDVDKCECVITNLMQRLQGRLLRLHDTVRYRTAIPTSRVYPQFIDLADIWIGLQDQVVVLSNINNFLWQLQSLSSKAVNVYNQTVMEEIADGEIQTDAARLERTMGGTITECGQCTVYYPNVTKDFSKIDPEFLGFCAWLFVAGNGALIPGNPNNGIAEWRGKYYAFGSAEAARRFGNDPDRYVRQALDLVARNPEYVHLFQLYEEIERTRRQEELTDDVARLTIRRDENVQTDVHLLPANVDDNYSWNLWEARRRALHLASISRRATRGTQTYQSHFRRGTYAQAAPPADKQAQTRKDNCTNTQKLTSFIFGLRGRRDERRGQHAVLLLERQLPLS